MTITADYCGFGCVYDEDAQRWITINDGCPNGHYDEFGDEDTVADRK